MKVTNLRTRTLLESLHSYGKVYERVLGNFVGFMVPIAIFGLSCCIIILLYHVIRYSELPLLIRIGCFYVAFTELFVMSTGCWDFFMLTRISGEVLWKLRMDTNDYILRLPRDKRGELLKRSRNVREWRVPVGFFTTFSLGIPVVIWEEILNQLIFLLSL